MPTYARSLGQDARRSEYPSRHPDKLVHYVLKASNHSLLMEPLHYGTESRRQADSQDIAGGNRLSGS